ncbi:MAG: DUF222 domain-containing protein [Pseudonocardiaceae bacterium]
MRTSLGVATLDYGTHISAAEARRWACDAKIIPVVLGEKSEPLDVGRAMRTVPLAIRRALVARDRGLYTCWRATRPRATLARICSAVAVHTNGFGLPLLASR